MTGFATIDEGSEQSCEATGHPTDCTEPVSGSIQGSGTSITINDADGNVRSVATTASTLHFDIHSHQFSDTDSDGTKECHDDQSHDLTGADLTGSSSINLNGNDILLVADGVATDPGSNSPINIIK